MKIQFESADKVNGLMTLTVEEADYKENVEKTLKDYRKKANIPGFRPGMVPMGLIKRQFGTSVKVDVINKALGEQIYISWIKSFLCEFAAIGNGDNHTQRFSGDNFTYSPFNHLTRNGINRGFTNWNFQARKSYNAYTLTSCENYFAFVIIKNFNAR